MTEETSHSLWAAKALAGWPLLRSDASGALFGPIHKAVNLRIERMNDQAILKTLKKRGFEAQLEPFSPHDLRRTFISDLLDSWILERTLPP